MSVPEGSLRVSVIVAHTRRSVCATLASLANQSVDLKCLEAIIVGHCPEHVQVDAYPFPVRYIECNERNPSLRRNLGMEAARAPIYAFIDDDACAERHWVQNALEKLDGDPELCLVGGPTLLPPGAGLAHRLTYKMAHAGFFGNGHENLSEDSADPQRVLGYVICCNMFVHAERMGSKERFDASIGYGGEDSMFVYRVSQLEGRGILYARSVAVYHSRGAFGFGYLRSRFRYRMNNGLILWAFPALYLRNPRFTTGVLLGTFLAILFALRPQLVPAAIVIHQAIAVGFSARYWSDDWRLTLLFPPALLLQQITYFAGIWLGALSILHPRQLRRVTELRRQILAGYTR